jgi:hypothetical protein
MITKNSEFNIEEEYKRLEKIVKDFENYVKTFCTIVKCLNDRDPQKKEMIETIEEYDKAVKLLSEFKEVKKTKEMFFETFLPFMIIERPILSDSELFIKSILLSLFSQKN